MTIVARWRDLPMRIRLAAPIGDDDLFELCAANRDLRIERSADGELLVMPLSGGEPGRRNFDLVIKLRRGPDLCAALDATRSGDARASWSVSSRLMEYVNRAGIQIKIAGLVAIDSGPQAVLCPGAHREREPVA